MFKEKNNTKFLFFYVIIVYVFAFMFWWSFLLYSKIGQHYSDAVNYRSLQYEVYSGGKQIDYFQTDEFQDLNKQFNREKLMILAEGSVFFLILIFGVLKVRQSIIKEVAVARQQKNFLLSITHELKSPLSSIKLMNETIKKRTLTKEKQDELLQNALNEVDRLEGLVENILIAAKIENDQYGFSKEKLNLSELCNKLMQNYLQRKEMQLTYEIEEGIYIEGDKVCMHSIISNLLDNAFKYAPNSPVQLSLTSDKQNVILSVSDLGLGVADEEKEKIFDKFYRIGNEETRAAKGTGLGLYIVKQLVQFHKGKIAVVDQVPHGTKFVIHFAL